MFNGDTTVRELLRRFPNGFAVSEDGSLSRTITGSSHLPVIAKLWPLPPSGGGYLVVDSDDDTCSECGTPIADCKCHER